MNQSNEESSHKGAQSIPPDDADTQPAPGNNNQKGTGVAASPFNGVKLDLGFILFGAVALLIAELAIGWPGSWGLAGYSMLCAFWLVHRTRKIARKHRNGIDGAQ